MRRTTGGRLPGVVQDGYGSRGVIDETRISCDWRGQGFFRALSEEQEAWALANGFHEIVVKTKNKFYEMRSTLDNLEFQVVKYERHPDDNRESKVYLSKRLDASVLKSHRLTRTVVQA